MVTRSPHSGALGQARHWALPGALLVINVIYAQAAEAPSGPPEAPGDLSHWGLYCYCEAHTTPHRIVRADDNGRILWAARDGVTLTSLRAQGLSVTESQLLLLRTYGLLEQNGERLTTTFAVIGPDVVIPLRQRVRRMASQLLPEIAPLVATIGSRLTHGDHGGQLYAVVFGYALDGLLWEELGRRKALPVTSLDLDHPLWHGAFWAMYPERSGAPGTNDMAYQGKTLLWVWTDHTLAATQSLLHPAGGATAPIPDDQLVINDTEGDAVHDSAQGMAVATADRLMDSAEGRALLAFIPNVSHEQAVLIVGHELVWELTEDLVSHKLVTRPAVFDAAAPSAADLQQLMFLRAPR